MPLVNTITPKRINVLGVYRFLCSVVVLLVCLPVFSQDNSPYSRYGLGDVVPSTNINGRAMGGIAAAYNDFFSINYNNPASYGSFFVVKEPKAKKISYGRAILDVGINLDNRTLQEPNNVNKFGTSNLLFSHIQVGVPLKPNWGLSFGLRPISRISYKIAKTERLFDPLTGLPIDSAATLNSGDGGSYLPSIGTGFKFKIAPNQTLGFGANVGYLFGKKDYSTRRTLLSDTVSYVAGNFQTQTVYGNLFYNLGMQYQGKLKNDLFLTIGAYGNLSQKLNAKQDIIRETYFFDESAGYVRQDSVLDIKDIKGTIEYPSTYTVGFAIERIPSDKKAGWLIGVDYSQTKWSDYRFYGQADPTVRDSWQIRFGAQLRPAFSNNYFSNVSYRAGFFTGPDYIYLNQKLPVMGITLGFGLPILNYSMIGRTQSTMINLSLEYIKRGNNDNLLKENMFRISAGLSLSDSWFAKKKYD